MDKFDELLAFLNSKITEYLIIPANSGKKPPSYPYVSSLEIPSAIDQMKEITEEIIEKPDGKWVKETVTRRCEMQIQFDSYSKDRYEARSTAENLQEQITTILRWELIRNGFGVLEPLIGPVENRTALEHSEFLYRYGFDITFDYNRTVARESELVETVTITSKDLDSEIEESITVNRED